MTGVNRVSPSTTPPRGTFARGKGFTLVELLIVIGIIAILVSILLPTIGKVRLQAQATNTASIIQSMAAAIERYRLEQGSYPGFYSNADITSGAATPTGIPVGITMTENMILSMCGGLDPGTAATPNKPPLYKEAFVGKGARTFNLNASRRKVLDVYLDATPGVRMPQQIGGTWATSGISGKTTGGDTRIPEYRDSFGDPRPILYLRAIPGNTGVSASDDSMQYNYSHLLPYQVKTTSVNLLGDFDGVGNANVPPDFANAGSFDWKKYLGSPNFTGPTPSVPRGANTFILISAGPDGIFGTKDDIFYGGN